MLGLERRSTTTLTTTTRMYPAYRGPVGPPQMQSPPYMTDHHPMVAQSPPPLYQRPGPQHMARSGYHHHQQRTAYNHHHRPAQYSPYNVPSPHRSACRMEDNGGSMRGMLNSRPVEYDNQNYNGQLQEMSPFITSHDMPSMINKNNSDNMPYSRPPYSSREPTPQGMMANNMPLSPDSLQQGKPSSPFYNNYNNSKRLEENMRARGGKYTPEPKKKKVPTATLR